MTTYELLLSLNGGLILVVGYFLVRTMNKLDTTEQLAIKTESQVALLKQETGLKHDRLEEKLDELRDSIITLTNEIKTYNNKN